MAQFLHAVEDAVVDVPRFVVQIVATAAQSHAVVGTAGARDVFEKVHGFVLAAVQDLLVLGLEGGEAFAHQTHGGIDAFVHRSADIGADAVLVGVVGHDVEADILESPEFFLVLMVTLEEALGQLEYLLAQRTVSTLAFMADSVFFPQAFDRDDGFHKYLPR